MFGSSPLSGYNYEPMYMCIPNANSCRNMKSVHLQSPDWLTISLEPCVRSDDMYEGRDVRTFMTRMSLIETITLYSSCSPVVIQRPFYKIIFEASILHVHRINTRPLYRSSLELRQTANDKFTTPQSKHGLQKLSDNHIPAHYRLQAAASGSIVSPNDNCEDSMF